MDISGTWFAVAWQAELNNTPIRKAKPGFIADLIIDDEGNIRTERKTIFGNIKQSCFRYEIDESHDNAYLLLAPSVKQSDLVGLITIDIANKMLMWTYLPDTVYARISPQCVYYKRKHSS